MNMRIGFNYYMFDFIKYILSPMSLFELPIDAYTIASTNCMSFFLGICLLFFVIITFVRLCKLDPVSESVSMSLLIIPIIFLLNFMYQTSIISRERPTSRFVFNNLKIEEYKIDQNLLINSAECSRTESIRLCLKNNFNINLAETR